MTVDANTDIFANMTSEPTDETSESTETIVAEETTEISADDLTIENVVADAEVTEIVESATIETEDVLEDIIEEVTETVAEEILEEVTADEVTETVAEEIVIEEPAVVTPDWVTHLAGMDEFQMIEFGRQTYQFSRVMTPDDEPTDKFKVFMKDPQLATPEGVSDWLIVNGMLTDKYSVVSLEKFVAELSSELGVVDTNNVRASAFNLAWFGDLPSPVDTWDSEEAKLIFALITGTPVEEISAITTKLSIMATNSYNGSSKLRLDYSLKTHAEINGNTDVSFRDYFSLVKYSNKIIHGQGLQDLTHDIDGIRSSIVSNIDAIKAVSIEADSPLIESIAKCFSVEGKNMFKAIWEGMVPDIQNLYYLTIIASIVLEKHWSIAGYNKSRNIIERSLNSVTSE